jgi:hypothetical protein
MTAPLSPSTRLRSTILRRTSWSLLLATAGVVGVVACGGDDPTPSGGGPTAGAAGAAGTKGAGAAGASGAAAAGTSGAGAAGASGGGAVGLPGESCTTDAHCGLVGIETKPANCAEAFCKSGVCALRAKDADGDGFRTNRCSLVSDGNTAIELGGDCDDGNAGTNPKGWDGPADGDNPDHCSDGVDQDCSGVDGDAVATSGASCSCIPDDVEACGQTSAGTPISFPGGSPVGACALGSRTCIKDLTTGGGKWGPCTNAIGPSAEVCNNVDDDCDGSTDEEDAQGQLEWVYDGDGDGYRAAAGSPLAGFVSRTACAKPSAIPVECDATYCGATPIADCCPADRWRLANTAPNLDCDDRDNKVNPAAAEVCATGTTDKDDNCDGQKDEKPVVGERSFYRDADGDGYADRNTPPVQQCAPPGPEWKDDLLLNDCDDTKASVNPGISTENCSTPEDDNCNNTSKDGCGCVDTDPKVDCGTPDDCVYLPADRACKGGVLAACSQPAVADDEYCPDLDADGACDLTKCARYCPDLPSAQRGSSTRAVVPAKYKRRSECPVTTDCADDDPARSPLKKELCGDAIDSDCASGTDNGYDLGGSCDVAGIGVGACKGAGTRTCSGPESTGCTYGGVGVVPNAQYASVASKNGSYDWNCDGKLVRALGLKPILAGQSPAYPAEHEGANFCVDVVQLGIAPGPGTPASPAAWTTKCLHPTPDGVTTRVPTCAELPKANCGTHYYFTSCSGPAGSGPANTGVTCADPCGKAIARLSCGWSGSACVATTKTGTPFIGCY